MNESQPCKAAWLTDLHLDHASDQAIDEFTQELSKTQADFLLISGDIGTARSLPDWLYYLQKQLSGPIYFVLGNHDYYGGSFAAQTKLVTALTAQSPQLHWLDKERVIELSKHTALLGHGSWADGRYGNFTTSDDLLNDFQLIEELKNLTKIERGHVLAQLGDQAACHFTQFLPTALKNYKQVLILTHVPPFAEATLFEGHISAPEWLPHFSCKASGDVLLKVADDFPDSTITVLCGHTHHQTTYQAAPNLRVEVGNAQYGKPKIEKAFFL